MSAPLTAAPLEADAEAEEAEADAEADADAAIATAMGAAANQTHCALAFECKMEGARDICYRSLSGQDLRSYNMFKSASHHITAQRKDHTSCGGGRWLCGRSGGRRCRDRPVVRAY